MSNVLYGIPGLQYSPLGGGIYTADPFGRIDNVGGNDRIDLLRQGCIDAAIWNELQSGPVDSSRLKQIGAVTIYTLLPQDNKFMLASTAATELTLNVPFGLLLGFRVEFVQGGAGDIMPVAAPAVTINSVDGYVKTSGQYARMELIGIAQDVYILTGDGSV